jgi:hypothetical protein
MIWYFDSSFMAHGRVVQIFKPSRKQNKQVYNNEKEKI